MQVEIWSDIACPWCYVGKRRFEAALAGFPHSDAVTVTWRSFELDPHAPRQHDMSQPELLARKYGMSITDAQAIKTPDARNDRYTNKAVPVLRAQTIAVNGNNLDNVSGASYTSYGWYTSLTSAMVKAGLL